MPGKRVRLRARECKVYANTTGFNRFRGRSRHEDIINNNNRFLLIHRVSELTATTIVGRRRLQQV